VGRDAGEDEPEPGRRQRRGKRGLAPQSFPGDEREQEGNVVVGVVDRVEDAAKQEDEGEQAECVLAGAAPAQEEKRERHGDEEDERVRDVADPARQHPAGGVSVSR